MLKQVVENNRINFYVLTRFIIILTKQNSKDEQK